MYTIEEWRAMSTAERVKIRREQAAIRRKAICWDAACFLAWGLVIYIGFCLLAS